MRRRRSPTAREATRTRRATSTTSSRARSNPQTVRPQGARASPGPPSCVASAVHDSAAANENELRRSGPRRRPRSARRAPRRSRGRSRDRGRCRRRSREPHRRARTARRCGHRELGRHAGPSIGHRAPGLALADPATRSRTRPPLGREPDRVAHQVRDDLLDPRAVRRAPWPLGPSISRRRPASAERARASRDDRRGELAQVHRRAQQLERALVGARERQEVLDDRAHALDLFLRRSPAPRAPPASDRDRAGSRRARSASPRAGCGARATRRPRTGACPRRRARSRSSIAFSVDRQALDLVGGRRHVDALVEASMPIVVGLARHRGDRRERAPREPPSAEPRRPGARPAPPSEQQERS